MYRRKNGMLEFFLVHPGGPFFKEKDDGVWTIPKGEIEIGEETLAAARREFREETGFFVEGSFAALTPIRQRSGKVVHAWAVEGDCDAEKIKSNTFALEWPLHSRKYRTFPEVDRAGWFTMVEAKQKINPAQIPLLEEVRELLSQLK